MSTGARGDERSGETLADYAYGRLRQQLITCEIRPGTVFSESKLADSLRLSKTPVREALLRLRLEGLIRVHSRTGYSAAPVTLKDARDVCALRALLNGEAAFRAAEHPERSVRHLGPHDPDDAATVDADVGFHLELARTAGNERLLAALEDNLLHYLRLTHLGLAIDAGLNLSGPPHSELIDAIGAGDGTRARDFVVAEVRQAEQKLVQAFISSHSVSSANVSAAPSPQHFYVDLPDPGRGGDPP